MLMRKDPPFDLEYVVSTWLLSAAVREGARVFNAPDAIRDHNEKLAIAEFARFTAPTLVVARAGAPAGASSTSTATSCVKRLDVMGGENVFRVRHDDPNRNVIVETISQGGARSVMAQRYIPEIKDGDKRVHPDRRQAGAALPRAHPEGGRVARQPRRRRARRGAAGHARAIARSPRRSARCSRSAACCWSAST